MSSRVDAEHPLLAIVEGLRRVVELRLKDQSTARVRVIVMDLEKITQFTATSLSNLIDLEDTLGLVGDTPPLASWAFRGQPRTYGTLAPSFKRVFGDRRSVRTAHIIESNLTAAFRRHYMTLQERTPKMPQPSAIGQGFDLRCLSVMQHYGVPTRLLDWTSNLWYAVYFACVGDPNDDAELWFYDRNIFNRQEDWLKGLGSLRKTSAWEVPQAEPQILSSQGLSLVFEIDPRITPRMTTQLAHHTVSTDVFADHAELIFRLFEEHPYGGHDIDGHDVDGLRRIVIAKSCKEKALKFLDEQRGITASTIFPDVEGLGRFLRWQLDSLLTTLL